METDENKKDPYVFYWAENEWTEGNDSKTERILGYDPEHKITETVLEISSKNFKKEETIVALAKSNSFLWYCCEHADGSVKVVKTDLRGRNGTCVGTATLKGHVKRMWANDKNVYLMTSVWEDFGKEWIHGGCFYRIDSKGQVREILISTTAEYFYGRINEDFFLLYNSYRLEACVWVFENDAPSFEEYLCDKSYDGGDGGIYREQTWCGGSYDGKAAVIKNYGKVNGEVHCQVLYVLNRKQNTWEESVLWKEEEDSHKTKAENGIFSFIQTGESELFVQSGPAFTLFQEDNMGLFVYEVGKRERRELCVTDGWCNTEGIHAFARSGRFVYTCIWCDLGDGYMLTEVDLDTGKRRVIAKDEREYSIASRDV